MRKKYKSYFFVGLLMILLFVMFRLETSSESFDSMTHIDTGPMWKTYVIHLEKETKKWDAFVKQYEASSLRSLEYNRFSAVVGKDVNPADYLTPEALEELNDMETNKRKLYHYQLTRGGIGCFLSHLALYQQLLREKDTNIYLILEDDIRFEPNCLEQIQEALQEVYVEDPEWDFLLLGWHRRKGNLLSTPSQLIRPTGFWGTYSYLVRRTGAEKMVKEVEEKRMDGQIDAVMSKMQQKGLLRLYSLDKAIVKPNTDISTSSVQTYQVPRHTDYDSYSFRGFSV